MYHGRFEYMNRLLNLEKKRIPILMPITRKKCSGLFLRTYKPLIIMCDVCDPPIVTLEFVKYLWEHNFVLTSYKLKRFCNCIK